MHGGVRDLSRGVGRAMSDSKTGTWRVIEPDGTVHPVKVTRDDDYFIAGSDEVFEHGGGIRAADAWNAVMQVALNNDCGWSVAEIVAPGELASCEILGTVFSVLARHREQYADSGGWEHNNYETHVKAADEIEAEIRRRLAH